MYSWDKPVDHTWLRLFSSKDVSYNWALWRTIPQNAKYAAKSWRQINKHKHLMKIMSHSILTLFKDKLLHFFSLWNINWYLKLFLAFTFLFFFLQLLTICYFLKNLFSLFKLIVFSVYPGTSRIGVRSSTEEPTRLAIIQILPRKTWCRQSASVTLGNETKFC